MAHFGKGKSAFRGDAPIVTSHRLPVDALRQSPDTDGCSKMPDEVGDEDESMGKLSAPSQETNGIFFTEMMKREKAANQIVTLATVVTEHISTVIDDLVVSGAVHFRDLDGGGVCINCVDAENDPARLRPINHHSRNVPAAGA